MLTTASATYQFNCRFFTDVHSFWAVQNYKSVTDVMNKLNKHGKATSISTFDFSTLYNKLPYNKHLMVVKNLLDFCFDEGATKIYYSQ